MARTIPTEESLGIQATEAEMAVPEVAVDDDISLADDPVEPETPETPKAEPETAEKAPDEPKMVDVRALQEARAAEREVKQRNAMLEQRLNDVLAAMSQQAQPQQPVQQQAPAADEPPPQDDPLALLQWLAKEVQQQKLTTVEAQQIAQQEGQRQYHQQQVAGLEQQFRASVPDYDAALEFAGQAREKELEILYPYSTADQRRQAVLQEWGQVTMSALQAGVNPAEQAYRYAQARGFNGQQAAQVAAPAAPKPLDTAAIASAQQRHQSLSDAPGGEVAPVIDAKALAKMDDKTFKAWLSKRGNESKLDEILGA